MLPSSALLLALAVVAAVAVAATALAVVRDGLGSVPPPRSHRPDEFAPGRGATEIALPSRATVDRMARLLSGLVLYGVAIALIVRAHLGVGPWDVLAQGLARVSGMSFGAVVVISGALLLLLWIPLRQRPGIGTAANVLLVGVAAQIVLDALPTARALPAQIALLAGGILLLAIATGLYVGAGLGAGPRDGLMLGLHARFGLPIWQARTLVEGSALLSGWLLGGQVGIGTVLFAGVIGPLCGRAIPLLAPRPAR